VDRLIKISLELSFRHYPEISSYIKQHSQEMNEEVMRNHIELYVNNFSLDLGQDGKEAILKLFEVYSKDQKNNAPEDLFIS
jgi:1,4-dihydroxy-6-naphthoate synthase